MWLIIQPRTPIPYNYYHIYIPAVPVTAAQYQQYQCLQPGKCEPAWACAVAVRYDDGGEHSHVPYKYVEVVD
eukprot:SAG31_NODE_25052_length_469_cov_0.637838_1_plen_72_part_00